MSNEKNLILLLILKKLRVVLGFSIYNIKFQPKIIKLIQKQPLQYSTPRQQLHGSDPIPGGSRIPDGFPKNIEEVLFRGFNK